MARIAPPVSPNRVGIARACSGLGFLMTFCMRNRLECPRCPALVRSATTGHILGQYVDGTVLAAIVSPGQRGGILRPSVRGCPPRPTTAQPIGESIQFGCLDERSNRHNARGRSSPSPAGTTCRFRARFPGRAMGRSHRHRDSNRTGQPDGPEVPHEGSHVQIPHALGFPMQEAAGSRLAGRITGPRVRDVTHHKDR